jgi:hypothetical protein
LSSCTIGSFSRRAQIHEWVSRICPAMEGRSLAVTSLYALCHQQLYNDWTERRKLSVEPEWLSRYNDWTAEELGFDSSQRKESFPFTTPSRLVLGPTHSPIQWVPGALSQRLKRPEPEADHLFTFSAENVGAYTSANSHVVVAWCLIKYRGNFTFVLLDHVLDPFLP